MSSRTLHASLWLLSCLSAASWSWTAGAAEEAVEISVRGPQVPRSASEVVLGREVLGAAPHHTASDLLLVVPGVFVTQHSGQGKAHQIFYRGFDAVHGQDLEFWVGGAPVNEVSNVHGQGYSDLHFVMPEVVSSIGVSPGNYAPDQGDFAVAGTIRYTLGYDEPGFTSKATVGSYGERRLFLAYHPVERSPASFAAAELQSTDGFGPARAASRTSGIVQHQLSLGPGQLRLLVTGYAGRFDSPGVVRLADVEGGRLGRFDTYGVGQGGFSSRVQLVADYGVDSETSRWSLVPYAVLRDLRLKQNYTGFLQRPTDGDTTQQSNEAATVGFTSRYRRTLPWLSAHDQVEMGVSLRSDGITQSQRALGNLDGRVLASVVDAKIRALAVSGFVDVEVRPVPRVRARAGLRVDGQSFGVQDLVGPSSNVTSSTDAAGQRGGDPREAGPYRSAMGFHVGPRASVDVRMWRGLHGVLSYGEGFRSAQARSLVDGEKTPFARVRSFELGVRYATEVFRGSLSAFRTSLSSDLVFDPSTTRNEGVPGTTRLGGAFEYVLRPLHYVLSSGSVTWTQATFDSSDGTYRSGDKIPYVPQLILRQDVAFTPTLGRLFSRVLQGRFGAGLTGMFNRPQPFGVFGHDVFLMDLAAELRLREVAFGLDCYNLLDARWFDSEFTFASNWNRGGPPTLVPERYVTSGAARLILATLSVFIG